MKIKLIPFVAICFFFSSIHSQDIISLGNIINSEQAEYAPSVSADGKTIIYQSNKDGRYKLYMANKSPQGIWDSKPIDAINNYGGGKYFIAGSSLSYDGNKIYFFAQFPGGRGNEDIWYIEKQGDTWSKPINAGPSVNSKSYEGFPSISSDGKRLFFMRYASTQKYQGKFCYELWSVILDKNGNWIRPTPLPFPINAGCENVPRIMSDNETLLFASIRNGSENEVNYDMYQSKELDDGTWSDPVPMTFINTPGDDLYGAIPSSGGVMYLNRLNGLNHDLYVTDVPENLRPKAVINVQGIVTDAHTGNPVEVSFILSKDDSVINASGLKSNAYDGNYTIVLTAGSNYQMTTSALGFRDEIVVYDLTNENQYQLIHQDIALSRIQEQINLKIMNKKSGKLINVEVKINDDIISPIDTGQYTFEGLYALDYKMNIACDNFDSYTGVAHFSGLDYQDQLVYEIGLEPIWPTLNITLVDDDSGEPLSGGLLLFFDTNNNKTVFEGVLETGVYSKKLDFGHYQYKAIANSHFYTQGEFDLENALAGEIINENISLVPIRVGAKLTLNNINFELGSSELTTEAKLELMNVINVLSQNRHVVLEISAHTDNLGSHDDNMVLSEERAHAVLYFFLENQVPESMLTYVGYGETIPIAPNNSKSNRAKNRRVEFLVKEVR